jgi:hypothetical protein
MARLSPKGLYTLYLLAEQNVSTPLPKLPCHRRRLADIALVKGGRPALIKVERQIPIRIDVNLPINPIEITRLL